MRVTEEPEYADRLLTNIIGTPRPEGVVRHSVYVTDVVRCPIRSAFQKLNIPVQTDNPLKFLVGNAVHEYLQKGIDESEVSVQEVNIRGRFDGIDEDVGVEFKTTDYSSNTIVLNDDESSWKESFMQYRRQILGYMFMRRVKVWRLFVVFLNGDYSFPRVLKIKNYKCEADQVEIDRNWLLLLRNRSLMTTIVDNPSKPVPPCPQEHQTECKKCPYNALCPSSMTKVPDL